MQNEDLALGRMGRVRRCNLRGPEWPGDSGWRTGGRVTFMACGEYDGAIARTNAKISRTRFGRNRAAYKKRRV